MDAFGKLNLPSFTQRARCTNRFKILMDLCDTCNQEICQCHTPDYDLAHGLSKFQVGDTGLRGEISPACEGKNAPDFYNIMPPGQRNPASRGDFPPHSANLSTPPAQYIDRKNGPLHPAHPGQDIDNMSLHILAQEIQLIRGGDNEFCNRMLEGQETNVPAQ